MNVNDIEPTPSPNGVDCLGNGEHEEVECCCDECEHYLTCFPDWKGAAKGATE